jgi:hypothetical protein
MPIDIAHEKLLTFAQAAAILPRRRAGRKTHVSTLHRWSSRGVKGIVLETLQVGGGSCTSREALQRFFDRLQITVHPDQPRSLRSTRSLNKKVKDAEQRLHEEGFN